ncbi:hypothetical protein CO2235_200079 [Cupriavidus oxalaticus]|uniref:Uncharacterized protein n=1 Tax=Cupriavidus oxalaticus TaxID=96344 RepID=A0A375G0R2_9BURK|nr:hypothetical protein CO2235_200079 [Cupriavidus oxalaticus]
MLFLLSFIFGVGLYFYALRHNRSKYWGPVVMLLQALLRLYDEMKGGFSDVEIFVYSIALTLALYWLIGQMSAAMTKCQHCKKLTVAENGKCQHCDQPVDMQHRVE